MSANQIRGKSVREVFSNEEISIIDLLHLFTSRRKYIFYSAGFTLIIGILVAITSPYEYEAESRILSETGGVSSSGGKRNRQLDTFRGLLGIGDDGTNEGGELGADLYPAIISSGPFLKSLIEEEFYFQEKKQRMTIEEYFSQERPGHIFSKTFRFLSSLPKRIFRIFEKEKKWDLTAKSSLVEDSLSQSSKPRFTISNLNYRQLAAIEEMESRLSIDADGRILEVKVQMPEPRVSAELNVVVIERIIDYVVAYKTEKQKENIRFIEERHLEAKAKFQKAQFMLAAFLDANLGMVTEKAKTRETQLKAEYDLAFDIYRSLASQLEEAKIQLERDTPLFTEFEPVRVPAFKTEPNIPRIILIYLFAGIALGLLIIFVLIIRDYMVDSKSVE